MGTEGSALATPMVGESKVASGGRVEFCGTVFAVTEGYEIAEVLECGALRVLGSESFFDATTGTRKHFVDVPGKTEAMLLLMSVLEEHRVITSVHRLF
jgi:hypothetical protein